MELGDCGDDFDVRSEQRVGYFQLPIENSDNYRLKSAKAKFHYGLNRLRRLMWCEFPVGLAGIVSVAVRLKMVD